MAKYNYKCPKCNKIFTIEKPMKDYNREEKCEECNEKLIRIFEPTHNKWECDGSYARGSY